MVWGHNLASGVGDLVKIAVEKHHQILIHHAIPSDSQLLHFLR